MIRDALSPESLSWKILEKEKLETGMAACIFGTCSFSEPRQPSLGRRVAKIPRKAIF